MKVRNHYGEGGSRIDLSVILWYNAAMFDDDFITGLAIGAIIAGQEPPRWRWSDFVVYGAAAIASFIVFGGVAYLLCR